MEQVRIDGWPYCRNELRLFLKARIQKLEPAGERGTTLKGTRKPSKSHCMQIKKQINE